MVNETGNEITQTETGDVTEIVTTYPNEPNEPSLEQVTEPAPEIRTGEAQPEEKSYTYQPTDDTGRPLGGVQVLKYRTQEELLGKLQEQNVLLIRRLRSETRKNRLGISDPEEIEPTAQRNKALIEFNRRNLSPDERVALSRNLLDPERFEQATDTLFESTLGVKPEDLRQTLAELQSDNQNFKVKIEADTFVQNNPGYVKCQENFEAITNWMLRYDLAPVQANFQKAYDTLRAAGVLVESETPEFKPEPRPEFREQPKPEPKPAESTPEQKPEPATIQAPRPENTPSRIPTGLTRGNSTDAAPARHLGDDIVYEVVRGKEKKIFKGLAAINAMPADVYRHRVINEAGFAEKEARLTAAVKAKAGRRF